MASDRAPSRMEIDPSSVYMGLHTSGNRQVIVVPLALTEREI